MNATNVLVHTPHHHKTVSNQKNSSGRMSVSGTGESAYRRRMRSGARESVKAVMPVKRKTNQVFRYVASDFSVSCSVIIDAKY